MPNRSEAALIALRQILRATDINARALAKEAGLTPSQLIILQIVGRVDNALPSQIARDAKLTQATVTSLIDKLERRGMVQRRRDTEDRRRVFIDLTDEGRAALSGNTDLLQDRFTAQFATLEDWEQSYLIAALERTAALLGAAEIDASPVLYYGAIDKPAQDD